MHVRLFSCERTGSEKSPLGCRRINLFCVKEQSITECFNALKDMEPDKSPGTDGLPPEFYPMFWREVSKPLIEALNYSFEIGQLSISQKRGIIKLIPKKSEELYYVKNWRPLSLLNCDYKSYKSCCKPREDPSPQTDTQ